MAVRWPRTPTQATFNLSGSRTRITNFIFFGLVCAALLKQFLDLVVLNFSILNLYHKLNSFFLLRRNETAATAASSNQNHFQLNNSPNLHAPFGAQPQQQQTPGNNATAVAAQQMLIPSTPIINDHMYNTAAYHAAQLAAAAQIANLKPHQSI